MSKTKVLCNVETQVEAELNTAKFFEPKHIYVNGTKGIVRVTWGDHTRTTSKCSGDDVFSLENGFRACLAKKILKKW